LQQKSSAERGAAADSVRTARASSSSTRRPEPPLLPRPVRHWRQRGQEMRASVQVTTTGQPRTRQEARSPRRRARALEGPNRSLRRSASVAVAPRKGDGPAPHPADEGQGSQDGGGGYGLRATGDRIGDVRNEHGHG